MQVVTQLIIFHKLPDIGSVDDCRLKRAEAYTEIPLKIVYSLDNNFNPSHSGCLFIGLQRIAEVFLCAIKRRIYSGEYYFLKALPDECLGLLSNLLRVTASHMASRKGNQTVGAEPVAALLYFDICPGSGLH